jgi:hypothetical protein
MAVLAATDTAAEVQCFLCDPCLDVISRTISECSAVQCSSVQLSELQEREELVGELIRELRFSCCELLLLEAGS